MQLHVSLRAGIHIEQQSTRTLVQAMLWTGGHQSLTQEAQAPSVSAYFEAILADLQQAASPPYDLLIVSCDDDLWRRSPNSLIALIERLYLWPLPLMVLTDVAFREIDEIVRHTAHVSFLPRSPLLMKLFFQTLGRLMHTTSQMLAPLPSYQPDHERLVQQECARTDQRHEWLDQRQEWLDQRKVWLHQRQSWIEARGKDSHPQQEWLAEQQAWIEQQWGEVHHQQRQIFDLRRWLMRYQGRLKEPLPPFREAQ